MEDLTREQLQEIFDKGIMIKELVWIKGEGYRIRERRLGKEFDCKFEGYNKENELYQYYNLGEEMDLIQESKKLEEYAGLVNDYDFDEEILLASGQRKLSVSGYEAMKFVVENEDENWSKSPYSLSYYNSKEIGWGYKPEGSLRISDHWNFGSENEHCKTSEPVDGWALCKFESGVYHLIKTF